MTSAASNLGDRMLKVKVHPSLSPFQVPYKTYLSNLANDTKLPYHWIAVGALTFDSQDRMLLIQRASTDSMPDLWEIPGGGCDEEDPSIIYSVARELEEEAGLRAVLVGPQVNGGYVFPTGSGKIVCKLNFMVEVENGENVDKDDKGSIKVKLDPKEHQNYLWATEEQCKDEKVGDVEVKFTTAEQKLVILDAFAARRKAQTQVMNAQDEGTK